MKKLQDFYEMLATDYDLYRRSYLVIKDKKSRMIPFHANIAQKIFEGKLKDQVMRGEPIRALVLKGRQEGITTDVSGLIFHDTVSNPNRKSTVVSHEPDSTTAIFDIYKNYFENLPPEIKPMKRYDNKNSLVFENPDEKVRPMNPGLKSSIRVFTANKRGGGRSQTIHNLHLSEVAFWEVNVKELMLGLLQAVPDDPHTAIIFESTANGTSGYFHDEYQRAKNNESEYQAIFIPWWVHEEFERPYTGFTMDDYERWLYDKMINWTFEEHSITHEQALNKLEWRRWAIHNKCNGSVKQFMQEYPATDKEAFQKKEGRVYYAFDRDRHVIPHFEPNPSEYIFFGGYDFGAEHPTAYGLFAIDAKGTIYKFREFKEIHTSFKEQAEAFKKMEKHRLLGRPFKITKRFRGTDSGAKQAELELKKYGIKLTEGITKREAGITMINGLFNDNKYYISDECVNTIYELENHVYKNEYNAERKHGILKLDGEEHKDADVIKELDDCLDGDRYGIFSFIHRRPKEQKTENRRISDIIRKEFKQSKKHLKPNW